MCGLNGSMLIFVVPIYNTAVSGRNLLPYDEHQWATVHKTHTLEGATSDVVSFLE